MFQASRVKMGFFVTMANHSLVTNLNYSTEFIQISASERNMAALAYSIRRHYLKVVCAIGLPGNLAALFTIATVRPVSTATFLVALLAASDSAALLVKLLINQLDTYLHSFNDDFCRSLAVSNACSSFANWVLVLIGFERLVAVIKPILRRSILSKRRVYCACVLVALLVFSIQVPVIAGQVKKRNRRGCVAVEEVLYYEQYVWPWLNTLVCALLPLLLLLVITTALVLSLRQAGHRRERLVGSVAIVGVANATRELRRSERAITSMTIAASLLFMLLVLPQCVYSLLFIYPGVFHTLRYTPKERLLRQITFLLADSTHALNFYLYFLSVRRFRTYFWKMLRCQTLCCESQASPSSTRSSRRDVLNTTIVECAEGYHINGTASRAGSLTPDSSVRVR